MSLDSLKARIQYAGGNQDARLVKSKLRSMQAALRNSYQAEWITYNDEQWRCLINPDKLNPDYDQKEISIEFEAGMKPGDVFYWNRTGEYWLSYVQEYSEEAYYRSRIRRCDYQIEVNGNKYWTYLRGPVETKIDWRQKHDLVYNDPNLTLFMYITKNEETNNFFKRFQIVKFDNHNWQVTAVDRYSQQGVIECTLKEYFDNSSEELMIAPEIVTYEAKEIHIDGPQVIAVYDTDIRYDIKNASNGTFVVNSDLVKLTEVTDSYCVLDVLTGKNGNFILSYKQNNEDVVNLKVTIESL